MQSHLSRYSIRAKLVAAFGLVLMATVGLGLFTMQRMSAINAASELVRTDFLPSVSIVSNMSDSAQQLRVREGRHLMAANADERRADEAKMDEAIASFTNQRKSYDSFLDAGEETEQYRKIDDLWASYLKLHAQLISASAVPDHDPKVLAALFRGEMSKQFSAFTGLFAWDAAYNAAQGKAAGERA